MSTMSRAVGGSLDPSPATTRQDRKMEMGHGVSIYVNHFQNFDLFHLWETRMILEILPSFGVLSH